MKLGDEQSLEMIVIIQFENGFHPVYIQQYGIPNNILHF
jgi:hypothetical protein